MCVFCFTFPSITRQIYLFVKSVYISRNSCTISIFNVFSVALLLHPRWLLPVYGECCHREAYRKSKVCVCELTVQSHLHFNVFVFTYIYAVLCFAHNLHIVRTHARVL